MAGDNIRQLAFILGERAAVGFAVPKMKHARREDAVFAPHTGMQQAHDDIGILLTPAAIGGVEAVDAIKIGAPNSQITRASAPPGALAHRSQRTKRQAHQR